ncbi:pentapeptide repeat-containing protein [Streptomyces virginiae]|uniref:pentapeptide repeat-containing protein n=1 Tax=Streptomyces virginiae TaxID=1961 RepID=UPI00367C49D6
MQQQPASDAGDGLASRKSWWRRVEKTVGVLASLSALILVGFTWKSITQVNSAQSIDREGIITDRYMAAVELLGNRESEEVRLGGLYGLQRVMYDSPRDQPTVINVVSTFIRARSPKESGRDAKTLAGDITAALTVLKSRDSRHDGGVHVDLHDTGLYGAQLGAMNLTGADLTGADLGHADLTAANLTGANLTRALLDGADLGHAKLTGADLLQADLTDADLPAANLSDAKLTSADLTDALLMEANLTKASLGEAKLPNADFSHAEFVNVYVGDADLTGADLSNANVDGTDLFFAKLTCTRLFGVDLKYIFINKEQLMSSGINADTTLPADLADEPELKKQADKGAMPKGCPGRASDPPVKAVGS